MTTGILLVNLGTPDAPTVAAVRRYLAPFLMDRYVIDVPTWVRALLVYGIILPLRPRRSAHAYQRVWTDEGSPLLVNSQRLMAALAPRFPGVPMALGMRYGNPSIAQGIRQLQASGCDRLMVCPLYPHYAMSTITTVGVAVHQAVRTIGFAGTFHIMPPFYHHPLYVDALARSITPYIPSLDYLLFSYHGIPVRHLKKTDPTHAHCQRVPDCCHHASPAHATCYRHQCVTTTLETVKRLGLSPSQYGLSFQSRLGKDKWLEPYTDATVEQLGQSGLKRLGVVCPAFLSDCLETLEEIGMEAQAAFKAMGGETFTLIPCLNDQAHWVGALHEIITASLNDGGMLAPCLGDLKG